MTVSTNPSSLSGSQMPNALASIHAVIERTRQESDRFAEILRHEHIPHLSFSQITAVEFCQYRYFLQYVELVDPAPVPEYFTKGKLLHWAIASYYDCLARGEDYPLSQVLEAFNREYQGESQRHLQNAVTVHLQNYWQDCQVIGVERPFVMQLDAELPPCVGVIDLILKKGDRIILVDHKTGRDFYPEDELQMAIYLHYVREQFGDVPCEFYYDHYRWVNNLERIRKPAFQRTLASSGGLSWEQALERIRHGAKAIQRIKTSQHAIRSGECFRCPYQKVCYNY